MKWRNAGAALCLALTTSASALAQTPVKPGKWELTSTYKGIPFGGDGTRTRTACLSLATLGANPEKVLMDASPPPSDDTSSPAPPQCTYTDVRREGNQSTWSVSCESPKMTGSGSATLLSPEQVTLQEKLELKMGFSDRTVQRDVRARRVGDCS